MILKSTKNRGKKFDWLKPAVFVLFFWLILFNSSVFAYLNCIESSEYTNSLGMTFNQIPAGTFTMGSPTDEPGRVINETQHQVTLTKDYYMMTTEVTQQQWKDVMGSNPSDFSGCDNCPVEMVSWNDIQLFIDKMNERGAGTYRLPTEAEWEYAARAGTTTAFANGDITEPTGNDHDPNLNQMGWYTKNSNSNTHPVAQKEPNAWGLYDMHGNLREWCQDRYQDDLETSAVTNPIGPSEGSCRVTRGGGWDCEAGFCRSASRYLLFPDYQNEYTGFRLVLLPSQSVSSPEICFSAFKPKTESPPLDIGEGPFYEAMLGQNVTLTGTLSDTSTINIFRPHVYDGFSIVKSRLYVRDRVLKKSGPDYWKPVLCQVEARISKVDEKFQDHNEIDIVSYKAIDMEPIKNGLDVSKKWVEANRSSIDLNRFKQAKEFEQMAKFANSSISKDDDLNKKPYQSMSVIKGVDAKRQIAEYLCGRYVLDEVPNHHGYFLDILIIYDLKNKQIIRAVVDHAVYFLE
jgi:formylglycine-generating enzyme required for sulfatase activity